MDGVPAHACDGECREAGVSVAVHRGRVGRVASRTVRRSRVRPVPRQRVRGGGAAVSLRRVARERVLLGRARGAPLDRRLRGAETLPSPRERRPPRAGGLDDRREGQGGAAPRPAGGEEEEPLPAVGLGGRAGGDPRPGAHLHEGGRVGDGGFFRGRAEARADQGLSLHGPLRSAGRRTRAGRRDVRDGDQGEEPPALPRVHQPGKAGGAAGARPPHVPLGPPPVPLLEASTSTRPSSRPW